MLLCKKCHNIIGYPKDFEMNLTVRSHGESSSLRMYSMSTKCSKCKTTGLISKTEKSKKADLDLLSPKWEHTTKYDLSEDLVFFNTIIEKITQDQKHLIYLEIKKYKKIKVEKEKRRIEEEERRIIEEREQEVNRIEKIKKDRKKKEDEEWDNSSFLQKYWIILLIAVILLIIIFNK